MNKIANTPLYSNMYKGGYSKENIIKAGYLEESPEVRDKYNLNLLTTPLHKLKPATTSTPTVLVSTGGFSPIHEGHLDMMSKAQNKLTELGYEVVGGYFAMDNDSYTLKKPYVSEKIFTRMFKNEQLLKNTAWSLDKWSAICLNETVNFTTIIERLRLYLQLHYNPNVKICYVFGGDNMYFMECFKCNSDYIGCCINRGQSDFKEFSLNYKGIDNCLFIDEPHISISSRTIRFNSPDVSMPSTHGTYLIRDEGMLPIPFADKNLISQRGFLSDIVNIITDYVKDVKVVKVENQLDRAKRDLGKKVTLSVDKFYKGTYNLNISRLFQLGDAQIDPNGLINLDKNLDLSVLADKDIVLVDDDSVSGNTIRFLKEGILKSTNISDIYLLANNQNENICDVVDLRDFLLGSYHGGLVVQYKGEYCRVPYMLPFVNLYTRASLPLDEQKIISLKILDANKKFYKSLGRVVTLGEVDQHFAKLFYMLGFSVEDSILQIIDNLYDWLGDK